MGLKPETNSPPHNSVGMLEWWMRHFRHLTNNTKTMHSLTTYYIKKVINNKCLCLLLWCVFSSLFLASSRRELEKDAIHATTYFSGLCVWHLPTSLPSAPMPRLCLHIHSLKLIKIETWKFHFPTSLKLLTWLFPDYVIILAHSISM